MKSALLFFWFLSLDAEARRHLAAPPPSPVVVAIKLAPSDLFDSLIYPARVVSRVNAAVLAESDGLVQEIHSRVGTKVAVGEKVLTLINPDPAYTYAPFVVLSPVNGVVSGLFVTTGSRVNRGQNLATITDPSQTHAQIEVTVSDLAEIHPGLKGELEVGETKVEVQVKGVSPALDPGTGTAAAELEIIAKSKQALRPGQMGRARFRARLHKGIQLPESAIFYRGDTTLVRILDDGKAVFREVKLGPARQGKFEVTSGLEVGETVVTRSNTFISDGEKVKLQDSDTGGT
jgi:multidrug efflux pump subunit AcrA (membrane-fusion protein)